MTRGAMPRWSGRRDSLQCEKAAMAAQQMARSREQLANMLRRLAFLSAAEEQQEVKTRTAPMMTGARRGSRVRPESSKTGAMKTTRVEMPVYWQRKNSPPEMARDLRKTGLLKVASLSLSPGGLCLQQSIIQFVLEDETLILM